MSAMRTDPTLIALDRNCLNLMESASQKLLGEPLRIRAQVLQAFGGSCLKRGREDLQLDCREPIAPASHRCQRVGKTVLFPPIGFAICDVESIEQYLESFMHGLLLGKRVIHG